MKTAVIAMAFGLVAGVAQAHVTVAPRQATQGSNQEYTVRVPAEGSRATTHVTLEIPAGVVVSRVKAIAGVKHEVTRADDRITAITWFLAVHPGEYAEFRFIARNPEDVSEIVWKAHAFHPDGVSTDWVNARGESQPASVTSLTAAPTTGKPGGAGE